jgi:hypothetical protein
MAQPSTATGVDMFNALKKRLSTQGFFFTDGQILTLVCDIMNVCNTDAANIVSHCGTEIAKNPPRPFVREV